jgi:hypothetical protein
MAAKSSIGAAGVPWRFRRLAAGCLFPTVLLLAGNLLASDDPMAAARQRLSAMSAAEKQELEGKQARFHGLSESEQQRVRQVHQDLSEAEDGEKLKQIMHRYSKWLRSLPSGQRAELVSLPPESRLERIKTLLREQEEGRMRWFVMRELTADDLALIVRWMETTWPLTKRRSWSVCLISRSVGIRSTLRNAARSWSLAPRRWGLHANSCVLAKRTSRA